MEREIWEIVKALDEKKLTAIEAHKKLCSLYIIEFEIGQTVYLKMDNEQHGRMVTGISLRPNRSVTYCLAFGTTETWHYGIEIDDERDVVKATTG